MEVRQKLRAARLRAEKTQQDVAAALGVNIHWVSKRETGDTSLSHEDVTLLAELYSLGDEDLLDLHGRGTAA